MLTIRVKDILIRSRRLTTNTIKIRTTNRTSRTTNVLSKIIRAIYDRLTLSIPTQTTNTITRQTSTLSRGAKSSAIRNRTIVRTLTSRLLRVLANSKNSFLVRLGISSTTIFRDGTGRGTAVLLLY